MTLRFRLVLTITAVLVTTMGATFTLIYLVVHRNAERQLNDALFAQAKEEALEIAIDGGTRVPRGDSVELADGTRVVRYAVLYGHDGTVLSHTESLPCPVPELSGFKRTIGETFDHHCGDLHLRAAFVGLPTANSTDVLLLAVPRTDLDGETADLVRTMALALLTSLALGITLALTLSSSLTRDHEAIARVVQRVASGDLSARVEERPRDREVQQLASDIDRMIARLQELLTAQEQFIAHAAHELRSPLTSAYGEIDLSLRRPRTAEEYRESMEYSHESLRRMTTLVQELLHLARAGSDEHARVTAVDLAVLGERTADSLSRAFADKGVVLERQLKSAKGEGREQELERGMRNLLENALRHTPAGRKVTLQTGEHGQTAFFAVADEGSGIAEADQPHLFEPFFRGGQERANDAVGSGLGLPIVTKIAKAHRGRIFLDTSWGPPGARFVVELKLHPQFV